MDDDFEKTAYTKKIGSKDSIYINPETGEEVVISLGQKAPSNFIKKGGKRLLSKRHKLVKKRFRKRNVVRTVRRKQRK